MKWSLAKATFCRFKGKVLRRINGRASATTELGAAVLPYRGQQASDNARRHHEPRAEGRHRKAQSKILFSSCLEKPTCEHAARWYDSHWNATEIYCDVTLLLPRPCRFEILLSDASICSRVKLPLSSAVRIVVTSELRRAICACCLRINACCSLVA
jgi:hypothetical protein